MNSKLMKYGLAISVVAIGGSIWMEKQMQKNFRSQDYYQNSVILLQKYEPAGQILGRPIFSGKLNLSNQDEFHVEPLFAKMSIPLKGSKQDGILHVIARRLSESEKWDIEQLDLEVKSSKQRWKFYDQNLKQEGQ